jgi:hypothetical protein
MRAGQRVRVFVGLAAASVAVWACETARNPGGVQRDLTAPAITLSNTVGDTQDIAGGLHFTVNASDNLALKTVRLTFSGGFVAGPLDSNFTGQVQTVTITKNITFPANSGAGGSIQIVGRAIDGAGNFAEDTLFIFLSNLQALQVLLIAPTPGAVASTGRGIPIEVVAVQNSGIRKIGFAVSPANAVTNPTGTDSVQFTLPLQDSVSFTDTVTVNATSGTFAVLGFAEDSAGRRATSGTVTVTVQSAANDNTAPSVSHSIGARVEVSDSVSVSASDASAIAWIGARVTTVGGALLRFDSVNVAGGNLTNVSRSFGLNLAALLTTFPTEIVVQGYACDGATARNCAFSQAGGVPGATPQADTVTVVAGVTRPLPQGGRIADAIFNANDSTLYLTNPTLSRVEIFQVANTSFVAAGIPTAGPQPWGIALWPRDTLGGYGDTIVVANAGGTELSVIDVRPGVRRLAWRQDLPNFLIQKYKVIATAGSYTAEIEQFDLSDRPQYLATVCRPAGGTTCDADSIFALYSTTPTISSTSPFNGRATLRMEKLKNTPDTAQLFAHFFWEIGSTSANTRSDTLRIVMRRGQPYNQTRVVLSACSGVNVDLASFGLGDTTFARNSGNFTHAFFGEGGNVTAQFARVMGYTAKDSLVHGAPTFQSCFTSPDIINGPVDAGDNDRDLGMSPGVDVSDFISNTGVTVTAIATNFNGGTNVVRADSVYYLDEGLRLKGTSVAPIGAPGMDMNYNHAFQAGNPGTPTFGGGGNPNDRILFAARPDGNIDVFDTFFYGVIGSIPVRDPIIGPLRVARNAAGTVQFLFGVTARGLVTVRLPTVANPFPAPRPGGMR